MVLEGIETEVQGATGRGHSIGIVPFQILRHTIPDIHGLKVWIIPIIKRPTLLGEFVRKLQLLLASFTSVTGNSQPTTRFQVDPSWLVTVLAEAGVSGSIRPVRMF